MSYRRVSALLISLAALVACNSEQPAEPKALDTGTTRVKQAQQAATGVQGGSLFQHTASVTRFPLRGSLSVERGDGFERVVSGDGAFFTDTLTGGTLAVRNATTQSLSRAEAIALTPSQLDARPRGFTQDPDQHSAAVRDYFGSAGLPLSEVGAMHVTTTMGGMGRAGETTSPKLEFLWYTSHLERVLNGVPVEGSHAYAAIATNGDVISESVYWPAIPADVVARASDLARQLAVESTRAGFLSKVRGAAPFDETSGQVKILHSAWSYHGPFEAHVIYDVLSPSGQGRQHSMHFDESGTQIVMPEERNSGDHDSLKLPSKSDSP